MIRFNSVKINETKRVNKKRYRTKKIERERDRPENRIKSNGVSRSNVNRLVHTAGPSAQLGHVPASDRAARPARGLGAALLGPAQQVRASTVATIHILPHCSSHHALERAVQERRGLGQPHGWLRRTSLRRQLSLVARCHQSSAHLPGCSKRSLHSIHPQGLVSVADE